MTICTGTDFVNYTWTTFVFDSQSKAKVSTQCLVVCVLKLYVNLPTWRLSSLFWIECNPKIHLRKLLRHLIEKQLIMPAM